MIQENKLLEQHGYSYFFGYNETLASSRYRLELKNIYLDSFPPSERIDFISLTNAISQEKRWLFTVRNPNQLIGLAIVVPLSGTQVNLLEYLAVDRAFRNRGIGKTLLKTISNTCQARNISGIVLEVEPDEHCTEQERNLRQRRIEYYRRNGAYLVECAPHYCMPNSVDEGGVHLNLMWIPLNNRSTVLSGRELHDVICDIYHDCYERPANDPLLQSILNSLIY